MFSTLSFLILYDTREYYSLCSVLYQVEPLYVSEVGALPLFIIQVFRICLVPSLFQTLPLQGATYWIIILSLRGSSLHEVCYFSLMLYETDLYLSWSTRGTCISYVSWGGSTLLFLWDPPITLRPCVSSQCWFHPPRMAHLSSWSSLLSPFIDSRKSIQVCHDYKPIFIAPVGTIDPTVAHVGQLIYIKSLSLGSQWI